MGDASSRLSLLHRAWRLLPAGRRRQILNRATGLMAPRIAHPPPGVTSGIVVAGELSRASGLGEGARLMLQALERISIPCWPLDIGPLLPAPQEDMPAATAAQPPPGAALILHVNAPMLPLVLLRLPRDLTRGRRVIGYWAWELSVLSHDWRGARLVHEAWVPSRFTAAAIETLLPGRVRVVAHPVAIAPRKVARPDRGTFGLPPDAVIVLAWTNLASSFARKNPARSDRRLSSRIRGTAGPCAVAEARQPNSFSGGFCPHP